MFGLSARRRQKLLTSLALVIFCLLKCSFSYRKIIITRRCSSNKKYALEDCRTGSTYGCYKRQKDNQER
jgi:hypothetical protein